MEQYRIVYSAKAKQHAKLIKNSLYYEKVMRLLDMISKDPYQSPPPFEKLQGELSGTISRRINAQHRLVYQVYEKEKTIKIVSAWTHYE